MDSRQELEKVLLKYGVNSVNETQFDGWTALMDTALFDDKEAAIVLLDNGADIEMKDSDKRTALFIAVEFENRDMAELLLERGADLNTRDNRGVTPLDYARERVKIFKDTDTGLRYAEIAKLLETWPEIQKQRLEEEKKAVPPSSKRPASGKHWRI